MNSRRVLLISYHFPPGAAVGGQRMANFARTLSALGWEPSVLTIADDDIEQIDRTRLRGLEGLDIHKVRVLPTLADAWTAANTWVRRLLGRRSTTTVTTAAAASVNASSGGATEGFVRRIRRYVLSFLLLPDAERGWILPASVAAVRRIRAQHTNWIMTSCPPYSTHLVGLAAKLATGVKWVADFRDPWMTTGSKRLFPTSTLSLRVESWLERRVIETADLVVFNVERLRNAYRAKYAHVEPEKFVYIPNGVTPIAAESAPAAGKYARFTIAYTGSLYVGRSPEPVLDALARLISRGSLRADDVCLKLIGQCRTINGVPTPELVGRYGLESVVEIADPVPVTEALDIVQRSHLALLLAPGLPYQIPAKFYDYLSVGTRMLAIAEDGGTSDLVTETGCGRAFASSDIDGIAAFIEAELTGRAKSDGARPALARFDVRRITADLAEHLERVSKGRQPSMAV